MDIYPQAISTILVGIAMGGIAAAFPEAKIATEMRGIGQDCRNMGKMMVN